MSNATPQADSATAAQLRALFFAVPASRREFGAGNRDLRNARINVAGEWVTLGQLSAVEVDALIAATTPGNTYAVSYFDRAASRASKPSIKVARFNDAAEADSFADRNVIYGNRCVVVTEAL